jgi:calpain-15
LQGVPSYCKPHAKLSEKDLDDFWNELRDADRRQYIMIASSKGAGEEENEQGIISGHAYSLIDLYELESNGQPLRLCKLRNPWGHKEWTGDWSDESSLWTPELKEKLDVSVADDGIFYMSWKDYIDNYKRTSVCINHNLVDYKHSFIYHDFKKQGEELSIFRFHIEEDIDCKEETFAISIAQQGPRLQNYRVKDSSKTFVPIRFNMIIFDAKGEMLGRYVSFKRFH